MRRSLWLLPFLFVVIGACKTDADVAPSTPNTMSNQLRITVGEETFTATLLANPTATAFQAQLPLTVSMTELNGNEKYYDLAQALPTNATNPGTIQNGDLLLYGSRTLVLFYKSFRTSYPYTRLGRIDNPAGLAAALGARNVTVTFALQ